ncbi:YhfX family PLP-dependent enzyme [Maledivibacter halophilus]|uniref:Predicted amino acid racemase n=1 Tax=Maledivibacter halophilus TaxID=36842 RepID=A0A1T5M0J6_9FIRM|nr:YhfX family PLP-dependent enzyme [Maledivibacter halophilus]SKC81761.1 Predicted amino acid racemase [Maledivibacter halophilus]
MFLDMTLKRNPKLIKYAVEFHRKAEIRPNSYILDMDTIKSNTGKLVKSAKKYGIELYMMTKQIGRNPQIASIIAEAGIEKAVAVDPWEALALGRAGIKLGNVGHLVQIPFGMIKEILTYKPEVITVFTLEKAEEISKLALEMGKKQDILLRVTGTKDTVYEGQVGGFKEEELIQKAEAIEKLKGVNIVGVTAFPCFLYDSYEGKIHETENAYTVVRCAEKLKSKLNIDVKQINMPSANAIASLPLMKELGATHGEPGHAITGTTPLHGIKELDEIPSIVYVSEISHCFENKAYVYGGGHYRRSNVDKAMVGRDFETMKNNVLKAQDISPEAIDYYGTLIIDNKKALVGDTAIYSFRTQIFVTRSEVVLVEGIQKDMPKIIGIYDSLGKKLR